MLNSIFTFDSFNLNQNQSNDQNYKNSSSHLELNKSNFQQSTSLNPQIIKLNTNNPTTDLNLQNNNNFKPCLSFPLDKKEIKVDMTKKHSLKLKEDKQINFIGFCGNINYKLCSNNEKSKLKVYHRLNYFIEQQLDVTNYMRANRKFDVFRSLILNKYQNLCFDFIKKVDPNDSNELDKLNIELDNSNHVDDIINYYIQKNKDKNLDPLDEKCFSFLDERIVMKSLKNLKFRNLLKFR